jgi:hypothetical protein
VDIASSSFPSPPSLRLRIPLAMHCLPIDALDMPPLSLDSSFILLTSDKKVISVCAALLFSSSTVFRDMLLLAADDGEAHCKVSETAEEVELFVEALKGDSRVLSGKEWVALFAMMDKYEVKTLRTVLLADAWFVPFSPFFPLSSSRNLLAHLLDPQESLHIRPNLHLLGWYPP